MNELRFAILGFGNIAKTHMTALRAMPIIKKLPVVPVLDTLVTRDPEANRAQAELIGFRRVTSSISEAAQDDKVHAFDVCTPNANHYTDVAAGLQGGKAIYCEKPVTEDYERSKELLGLIESGPAVLEQLAFTFRYHPAVMRIRRWLEEGLIGDVLQCKIAYRRSGYLNPERPVSWRLQSGMSGGGAISDLGVHALDLLRHWFGELMDVRGRTNTYVKQRPDSASGNIVDVDVDDWAMLHYFTASGVSGTVEVSRIALGSDAFDIQIVGKRGSITCDLERDAIPTVHLLKGGTSSLPAAESLSLLPDEKGTMGFGVDTHFGALYHFLWRYAGEDRFPGLAPTIADGVQAEYWIDRVLKENKGLN
ncbi:Gfo/Idh/MocA family oxidoreductase [Paenibacillus oenotherae]|uniref:Gfo/Idh/MocA family oxidoreductase n=1 Tax=Paenibacillus oenotherae TaxID=1435645 RepID=A0ABS7DD86_9BACL|nr:Gfo/Idh/MocA family oxidoreductase [Paenibacillus oenotherae]MBW7477606.1 Gfo/Idh/MocA family oxidoreductase [Paenibacillus oenotherae]